MIVLPYFLLGLFVLFYIFDVRKAILLAVIIRPVTDCFFDSQYAFAGIKPTEYLGFLLPTLICIKIIISREQSFSRAPFSFLWTLYLFFQLFSTVLVISVGNDVLLGLNYFFRVFNGFIGFFLFQEFFKTREDFKILVLAHLAAGFVPLGMSVYQNILGGVIRSETTIGDLVRNIGFYHDAYTIRFYCFQTLAAVILYWCYFLSGVCIISRALLLAITAISILTIYKIYSKAGYLVAGMWLIVWHLGQRKFISLGIVIIVLVTATIAINRKDTVLETLDSVYSKEVDAIQGKEKSDRLFQGRVGGWKILMKEFFESPIYLQLVGDGSPHTGAHNDFIRALLGTGVIGLFLYLSLLWAIGNRTLVNCFRVPSPLNTLAVMLVAMWFIDAMGLVPGAYPGYQIFVWGLVGLALRGVKGLDERKENVAEVSA